VTRITRLARRLEVSAKSADRAHCSGRWRAGPGAAGIPPPWNSWRLSCGGRSGTRWSQGRRPPSV